MTREGKLDACDPKKEEIWRVGSHLPSPPTTIKTHPPPPFLRNDKKKKNISFRFKTPEWHKVVIFVFV